MPNGRQPRRIIINETLAPHLRIIWEMAAENKSLSEIGHELIQRKVPTANGKVWRKQSVAKILKNPFYKGLIRYSGETSKGDHPPMIDDWLWERGNRILSAKLPGHGFARIQKDYNQKLKGIMRCGKCGSYFVCAISRGHTGQRFYYYECSRARQRLGCDTKRISATAFDDAVIYFLGRASKDREIIIRAIGNAIKDSIEKLDYYDKEIRKLEKELTAAKESAEKLLALALEGVVPKGTTYKEKMDVLETEIATLTDKLEKTEARRKVAELSVHSGEYLHSNLSLAMEYLDEAPPEAQISLLKALIKTIDVHEDRGKCGCMLERRSKKWLPESTPKSQEPRPPKESRVRLGVHNGGEGGI